MKLHDIAANQDKIDESVKSGFILVILEKYFRENFGKTAKKLDKPRITCYSLVGLQ